MSSPGVLAEQVFGILLPGGKGYVAMLTVYLDASGVTPADKHFVIAGFVAPTDAWKQFENDWATLLAIPRYAAKLPVKNGKRYAHAKRIAQWPETLREAFYGEANYLLRKTVLFGVAATFQHADYEHAFKGYPFTVKDSRYGLGFRSVLTACCKRINAVHDGLPLAFVVEHGDPNQGGALRIFNWQANANKLLKEAHLNYNVSTFTVAFKEDWGALQAADMHAYTLLKHQLSPMGRKTGKSDRYFGDINLLLQEIQLNHFVVDRTVITNIRRGSEFALLKPKIWGKLRKISSPSAEK